MNDEQLDGAFDKECDKEFDKEFDKELSALYQQRKSQIVAPSTPLNSAPNKLKSTAAKFISIFMVAGVASFGIMAIMSHFAEIPATQNKMPLTQHHIKITEVEEVLDDKVVMVKPKLPPLPQTPTLTTKYDLLAPMEHDVKRTSIEKVKVNTVQVVKLPHLKEPEFIIKPVHKVMPNYSQARLQGQQSGAIKLRYNIDEDGNVMQIDIVSADVNRELQRATRKALSKWKYPPNSKVKNPYEIIFEFNMNE